MQLYFRMEETRMTLKEKYELTVQQMQMDAVERLKTANEKLEQKDEELSDCEQHISDLKATAATARGKFWEVGKTLIKMYFQKTETPEEVEQVITPCNTFVAAAGALPAAEERAQNIANERAKAEDRMFKATRLLNTVQSLAKEISEEE